MIYPLPEKERCCLQIVVYLVGSYNLLDYHQLIDVKLMR